MKQITQKEFIKLIEAKQENAENTYKMVHASVHSANKIEEDARHDRLITNKAYIDAYQDLICQLKGVEIVPEESIGSLQENLKEMLEKAPITPYADHKVEPQRNDRFRDFENGDFYVSLDAKEVSIIKMQLDDRYKTIEVSVNGYYVKKAHSLEEYDKRECLAFYKDLIEWRNYWKQN